MLLKSLLAATGLIASGLLVTQPAQAATPSSTQGTTATCSLAMPAKLVMRRQINSYIVSLGADCPTNVYTASWVGARTGNSNKATVQFEYASRRAQFTLYSWISPVGTMTWTGNAKGGTDYNGAKVATLKTAVSVTKYASSATLTGGHQGTKTALIAAVGYYNPKTNAFTRWPSKKVLLQYQEVGSTVWKGLAYATTNATGQASYTYYPGKVRRYRVAVPTNATIWDFTSATLTR